MNKVILMGRLCADVETHQTNSGKMIANYRLAVDRGGAKQEGEQNADFLSCVAFENNANFASQYLHKGMKILVEGRIRTRDYTNKDGQKVYVTEIIVDRHEFCESKNVAGTPYSPAGTTNSAGYTPSPAGNGASYVPQAYQTQAAPPFETMAADDELPF